jgi:calcineurin-like phosphoesterase family protein
MADIWFISDTHFCHENIIGFSGRPFLNVEEMNEAMIENWNKVVKPQDKIWHLGDVALGYGGDEKHIENILRRLNGHKRLIVGNHDHIKSPVLHKYFDKIELWNGFGDKTHSRAFTCSHIPLPIDHLRNGDICVHGHLHNKVVLDLRFRIQRPHPNYINVCVEHTNYTPIHIDEIWKMIEERS